MEGGIMRVYLRLLGHLIVTLTVIFIGCDSSDNRNADDLVEASTDVPRGLRVETSLGPVVGTEADGLRVFRGIPYAEAPVGALRFKPPVATTPWTDDFVADAHGAACPQLLDNAAAPAEPNQSEDCLSVNVWAHKDARRKPVMIWVHGGAFVVGNGGRDMYDAGKLATRGDVVVVTFNYRIGMLGFLALDALRTENESGATGNYATLDQRMVFQWVQDNIEAFGGDPNNVTIFGQSAGAVSICSHLGMPASDGLYHRAIIQSATGCYGPWLPEQVEADSLAYVTETGCADTEDIPACLRALSIDDILDAQRLPARNILGQANIGPYVDGVELPTEPLERLSRGEVPRVPILLGNTALEVGAFTLLGLVPAGSESDYDDLLDLLALSERDQQSLKSLYPLADYRSVKTLIDELGTDFYFACPSLLMSRVGLAAGYDMWQYEFGYTAGGVFNGFGALHSTDEFYLFGHNSETRGFSTEIDEIGVAYVQDAWSEFARTGALSVARGWPKFTAENQAIRAIDAEGGLIDTFRNNRCEALFEAALLPLPAAELRLAP